MKNEFIRLLKPQNIFKEKMRLGPKEDGGYVFPKFVFDECTALFSYGIGSDSRFENEFCQTYHKPAYLFDHTTGQEPWERDGEHFYPEGLGFGDKCKDFHEHYDQFGINGYVILKIDIEAGEYEYFPKADIAKMAERVMAISLEVHWIDNPDNREKLEWILKELNKYFILNHVHGNNWGLLWHFGPEILPVTLELTFVNRKFVDRYEPDEQDYPIEGLDCRNDSRREDYKLKFLKMELDENGDIPNRQRAVVAIYGSHNSAVSLAINEEVKEVIEIERLVGKKNASLYWHSATQIKNRDVVMNWISNYFKTKYNITEYDMCLHDVVDLDHVKKYFPAKEYQGVKHHESHAYGTLYQCPWNDLLILSFDGGGNDGWFVLYRGNKREHLVVERWENLNFGVCYGMFGHYLKTLKHEESYDIGNLVYAGKLMGLAGYGKVREEWLPEIREWYKLPTGVPHIDLMKDMLFRLGIKLDENNLASDEDSRDLAATSQFVFEEYLFQLLDVYLQGWRHIAVGVTGGGGLNILFNTALHKWKKEVSDNNHDVFIAPNPNDCGLSAGMLLGYLKPMNPPDLTYSGLEALDKDLLADYTVNEDAYYGIDELVDDLVRGAIVGTVIGRSEHGPRALGNRSILCNPSIKGMKDTLNAKVKHREWYRPFAPVVRLEDVNEYFEWSDPSRWMSFCPKVKEQYKEKLESITHIDGTARVQTVTREENAWLYDLLTKFKEKSGIGVLLNTSFNIAGKPILNSYKDAFKVYNSSEMDGLFLENVYIRKSAEQKNKQRENTAKQIDEPQQVTENKKIVVDTNIDDPTEKNNLTVVTGLWNINRPGRSFDAYIEQFKKVLDIDCKLFIHIQKEYEHIVWENPIRTKANTYVQIYELEDIRKMVGDTWWNNIQAIRQKPEWYNQAGWLPGSPQATLEWYNPIVMSKYSMLHNVTIWNPFNTDYFLWLDAGISFTVYEKYFTENKVLDKIIPYLKTFLFLSYPYQADTEIHGFTFSEMNKYAGETVKYVCRGGLFGGHKDFIREGNNTYWQLVNDSLARGYMGTEESIFAIMAYRYPEIYRRYSLDDNGLIVKFIDALDKGNVVLEPIPEKKISIAPITPSDLSKLKTNVYILTFNFPEQLQYTINSMEKVPEWLGKPHLVLIDNSTSDEPAMANKAIAEKYNMEYIRMERNTGICGGRQKAAEHFHESDADFMLFFEDDMTINSQEEEGKFCRNGFRKYIPNLYDIIHKIMLKEGFDFLKLSWTEVYFDNDKSLPWYNVPQDVRTRDWPDYDKLPATGLDPNSPPAHYKYVKTCDGVAYIIGDVNYANWPMIVSKAGNKKIFIDTKWAAPYEQTWSSHVYNLMHDGKVTAGLLLASPIWHNRIKHYKPEERREN